MNFQDVDAAASPEVQMNENFETIDALSVYGKRHPVTSGLTWGYYGGRWGGFAVAAGTLTLTNGAENYISVLRSTGAISVEASIGSPTSAPNWDNTDLYARVYKVTVAGNVVTATEDHRAGRFGIFGPVEKMTAPTILSGFCASPSVVANNGPLAFTINVGTQGSPQVSSGVIGLPAAPNGWALNVHNLTAAAANRADQRTVQTATTTTSATVQNQKISTGAAADWNSSDVLLITATPY